MVLDSDMHGHAGSFLQRYFVEVMGLVAALVAVVGFAARGEATTAMTVAAVTLVLVVRLLLVRPSHRS